MKSLEYLRGSWEFPLRMSCLGLCFTLDSWVNLSWTLVVQSWPTLCDSMNGPNIVTGRGMRLASGLPSRGCLGGEGEGGSLSGLVCPHLGGIGTSERGDLSVASLSLWLWVEQVLGRERWSGGTTLEAPGTVQMETPGSLEWTACWPLPVHSALLMSTHPHGLEPFTDWCLSVHPASLLRKW